MGGISTAFQWTGSAIVTLLTITLSLPPSFVLVLPPSLSVVQTDLISRSLTAGWLLSLLSPLVCSAPPLPLLFSFPLSLHLFLSLTHSLTVSSTMPRCLRVSGSQIKLERSCRDSQHDTRKRHHDMSCAACIHCVCKIHYKRANIRPPWCSAKICGKICRWRQSEMKMNQINTGGWE